MKLDSKYGWRVALLAAMAMGLLAGCGGSKARRYELTKDDLAKHQQVLLVRGGPALVQLDVGLAGKLAMKGLNKIGLPDGACEEAASAGADSALILYQRLTIDVGATKSLAVSELWAHLFDCPAKQLLWRERDKRSLSLTKFVMNAAKQAITKEDKTLADFLSSLRSLVEESAQAVLTKGMSR